MNGKIRVLLADDHPLMTEGLKLTLQIAKCIVPEDEIYLRVNKDNIASQKVMLNNGAYQAGEDEEHFFMRIPKNR